MKKYGINVEVINKISNLKTTNSKIYTVEACDWYPIRNYFAMNGESVAKMGANTIMEYEEGIFEMHIFRCLAVDMIKNGIGVMTLGYDINETGEYQRLQNEIDKKNNRINSKSVLNNIMPAPEYYESFYEDYYSDLYASELSALEFTMTSSPDGKWVLKDKKSQYANVINGRRITIGQPDNPKKTIYFFGPCYILGAFCEDKHTIESFLQDRLNYEGYNIKVENYGAIGGWKNLMDKLILCFNEEMQSGDIVVVSVPKIEGVPHLNVVEDIFVKEDIKPEYFTDDITHHNHVVNSLVAKGIYNFLLDTFDLSKIPLNKRLQTKQSYIKHTYIDRFFDKDTLGYEREVGAIVMNCNPFTYGHKFLIQEAKKQVSCLIVFVVQEDESLFSFNSRYAMVKAGTKKFNNVIVVPSGNYILSKANFAEYFVKVEDENVVINAEKDIEIFGRNIAPHLRISKRFVGEELSDPVTAHYNDAMKKILPQYGVELIEIPRKEIDGKVISATLVRECLENVDMQTLKKFVPQSTIDIMFWENE